MKALTRAYIVLLGFLAVGAVAAWYILWHVTSNNCAMATDGTENCYRMWAICLGVTLGIAGGCIFALIAPKRQFLHALLFAIAAVCIGFALLGFMRYIMYPIERFDTFTAWTNKHGIAWLSNIFFWVSYWIADGIYSWLLPQLITQLSAVAITQWAITRYSSRQENYLPETH